MQTDLLAKLKALAEPSRLRIVSLLSQGEMTVSGAKSSRCWARASRACRAT